MANAVNILSMLLPPVAADAGAPAAIPPGSTAEIASSPFASLLVMLSNAQPASDLRTALQAGIAPITAPKFPTGPIVPADTAANANKRDRTREHVSDDPASPVMAMPMPGAMLQTPPMPVVMEMRAAPTPESNITADELANVVSVSRAPVSLAPTQALPTISPAPTQALPTMKLPAPMPVLATEQTPTVVGPQATSETETDMPVKTTPAKTRPPGVSASPLHKVSRDAQTVSASASARVPVSATPIAEPVVDGARKVVRASDQPTPANNPLMADSTQMPSAANTPTAATRSDRIEKGTKSAPKPVDVSSAAPRDVKAIMTTSVVAAQRVNPVDADVAQPKSAIAVPASTTVTPLNMGDARATTPPPTPQTAIVQSTIVAPVTAMPVGQPVASKVTTKQAPADAPRATAAAHESLPRTIVATAADALRAVTGPAASGPTAATNQIADNETAQPRADANDKTAATAPQANAPAPATHTALPVGHNAAPHVADTPASAAPAQVQAVTHAAPVAQAAQTAPAQTTSAEQPVRLPEHASSHDAGAAPEIQALAVRIAAKSAQGNKRFDIRLDPPELGRIDVRLDVDANGRATAQLAADKPQTVDLLSRDHRQLERALKDAGLDLGSMSFSLKGDERQQTPRAVARPQTETRTSAPTIASVAPIARWSLVADARVDIRI